MHPLFEKIKELTNTTKPVTTPSTFGTGAAWKGNGWKGTSGHFWDNEDYFYVGDRVKIVALDGFSLAKRCGNKLHGMYGKIVSTNYYSSCTRHQVSARCSGQCKGCTLKDAYGEVLFTINSSSLEPFAKSMGGGGTKPVTSKLETGEWVKVTQIVTDRCSEKCEGLEGKIAGFTYEKGCLEVSDVIVSLDGKKCTQCSNGPCGTITIPPQNVVSIKETMLA